MGIRRFMSRFALQAPPDWLFQRSIVQWTSDRLLRAQLPLLYQILGFYCSLFFHFKPHAHFLRYGQHVLQAILSLQRLLPSDGYRTLRVEGTLICVDLTDPRFLKVVSEVQSGSVATTLRHFLKKGDTFIDVGANQGAYSVIASILVGEEGYVISIEPQRRLANAVAFSLRQLPAPFRVYNMAVGNREGVIDMFVPTSYSGTASVFASFSGADAHEKQQVRIARFDQIAEGQEYKGNVFIKLDVEGSEFAFLNGALQTIQQLRPKVLMEINPTSMRASGTEAASYRRLLQVLRYDAYIEENDLHRIRPINTLSLSDQRNVVLLPGEP